MEVCMRAVDVGVPVRAVDVGVRNKGSQNFSRRPAVFFWWCVYANAPEEYWEDCRE